MTVATRRSARLATRRSPRLLREAIKHEAARIRCEEKQRQQLSAEEALKKKQERLTRKRQYYQLNKEHVNELKRARYHANTSLTRKQKKIILVAIEDLATKVKSIKQHQIELSQGCLCELDEYRRESNECGQRIGQHIRGLQDAAQKYYEVLGQNKKLHNELQELKGNIRVYCRIRPFSSRHKETHSSIEYIGGDGELVVVNPDKPGKEGRKLFKFNKVYGHSSTQGEVFSDIQPLIRSTLDGYNVCIFAYGQTGAGKTYTMMGPEGAKEEQWGVIYRALNDLFSISKSRESTSTYEIRVQMVEIYNEKVRDLLPAGSSQKKLGILSNSKSSRLAVPNATMFPVEKTSDVLELMDSGLKNAAKSSTALNERSSRSHSVITIHVCGTDLKTGSSVMSNLHLVDLAGSERVVQSKVTGDALKEAQHINKSLSALGDVIFALAQKSSHIPYRNSKLTQVLQSSLGGNAKTLMFVHLNPDVNSYSETISTLKFAERVSGVELGAAKSTKGQDVRESVVQVATLKDTTAKKVDKNDKLLSPRTIYKFQSPRK